MEVVLPVRDMDFDFNSARNSPYPSAPSTPRAFGEYYFSAPPSPSHNADFYGEFDDYIVTSSDTIVKIGHGDSSELWEAKPGRHRNQEDFAFDVSEEAEEDSISAEELFDGGMIKPTEPPPSTRKSADARQGGDPSSRRREKMTTDGFPPKPSAPDAQKANKFTPVRERGRGRTANLSSSSRRATRSLSPSRGSDHSYPGDEEQLELLQNQKKSSAGAKPSSSKSQKKWRFKDFFLFRNASEGRASDKDLLRKYTATFRVVDNNAANNPAVTNSNLRRKGPVSAHELHYTENRAAREELKKKTFLPYKGFWGRTPFNAALANGLGFSHHK